MTATLDQPVKAPTFQSLSLRRKAADNLATVLVTLSVVIAVVPLLWGLYTVVVKGISLQGLSEEQHTALRQWIASGGTLIAAGESQYTLLTEPRLRTLLPVEVLGRPVEGPGDHDLPAFLVQVRGQLLGQHEAVGRAVTADVGVQVVRVVADDQQSAAGPDRGGQPGQEIPEHLQRQVHVLRRDQAVPARFRGPGEQVLAPPADPPGHLGARGLRRLGAPVQGDLRHVRRGDRPPAAGQPDRVAALAAARVQRLAGLQAGCLGH